MVTAASKVRRLAESVISPDLAEQVAYEQIVIDYMVTYRTVFELAAMGFSVKDTRKFCESATTTGDDPLVVAHVIQAFRSCAASASRIEELFEKLIK